MIDIIISCLVAGALPDMVLWSRMQQTGLSGSAAMVSALSRLEVGGLPGGMACLMLAEVLAVLLILKTIGLYYIHWVLRNYYETPKDVEDAVDRVSDFPISPFLQRKIRRGIILQYFRGVWAKRDASLRQEKQIQRKS